MRIPVFAVGANPAIDRPILRKKLPYVLRGVAEGLFRWVGDRQDLGVICLGRFVLRESVADGGTFDAAWRIIPSGPERIGVWQLKVR